MKTSELTGTALDWAVAKCEGLSGATSGAMVVYRPKDADCYHEYAPSTDWSQGGPIIEREKIDITWDAADEYVLANKYMETEYASQTGPTPLIAAMRCFVASRLGDDVDIPAELM